MAYQRRGESNGVMAMKYQHEISMAKIIWHHRNINNRSEIWQNGGSSVMAKMAMAKIKKEAKKIIIEISGISISVSAKWRRNEMA
jgi:hypothetical protein